MIDLDNLPGSTLLNDKQVSEVLGVPTSTLNMWRVYRRVPLPFVKLGKQVRYRVSDVRGFIDSGVQNPTEAAA